jgi:hypothetical protein
LERRSLAGCDGALEHLLGGALGSALNPASGACTTTASALQMVSGRPSSKDAQAHAGSASGEAGRPVPTGSFADAGGHLGAGWQAALDEKAGGGGTGGPLIDRSRSPAPRASWGPDEDG